MEKLTTKDLVITDTIEENENYKLSVVFHPEMGFPTYAIVNKKYDVIEMLQPNLFSAQNILREFNSWLLKPEENKVDINGMLEDIAVEEANNPA